MAFDRRKMRFTKGVVLTQAQWDELRRQNPLPKINAGTLLAIMAGLAATTPRYR